MSGREPQHENQFYSIILSQNDWNRFHFHSLKCLFNGKWSIFWHAPFRASSTRLLPPNQFRWNLIVWWPIYHFFHVKRKKLFASVQNVSPFWFRIGIYQYKNGSHRNLLHFEGGAWEAKQSGYKTSTKSYKTFDFTSVEYVRCSVMALICLFIRFFISFFLHMNDFQRTNKQTIINSL